MVIKMGQHKKGQFSCQVFVLKGQKLSQDYQWRRFKNEFSIRWERDL